MHAHVRLYTKISCLLTMLCRCLHTRCQRGSCQRWRQKHQHRHYHQVRLFSSVTCGQQQQQWKLYVHTQFVRGDPVLAKWEGQLHPGYVLDAHCVSVTVYCEENNTATVYRHDYPQDGVKNDEFMIEDMVFQSKIWGPIL